MSKLINIIKVHLSDVFGFEDFDFFNRSHSVCCRHNYQATPSELNPPYSRPPSYNRQPFNLLKGSITYPLRNKPKQSSRLTNLHFLVGFPLQPPLNISPHPLALKKRPDTFNLLFKVDSVYISRDRLGCTIVLKKVRGYSTDIHGWLGLCMYV